MPAVRSPMVADVGARIRSLRTAKGMTQAQVAEPNYTKAYISMLESGRTRASMKALEHIAGVLGVKPADLLGGVAAPATPQYQLLEARRYIEQQRPTEAIPILEALEEGLGATDQLVRLRFLATAFNMTGQPKAAFPLIERAQRMAELLEDEEEKVRVNAVLASAYSRTYAYEEALRLLREIVAACEDGVPNDPAFHFRRLVDLAVVLTNLRQPKQALAAYERAIVLGEKFSDRPALGNLYAGMAKTHQNEGTLASVKASEAEVAAKTDPKQALEIAQEALKFARKVDQPDAQVRLLVLLGELRMNANAAAARRSFQEARLLAEERAPHLLRVIFDRWSHAAESTGDSEEALRLARRALETART